MRGTVPRRVCRVALIGGSPRKELFKRAADAGDACASSFYACFVPEPEECVALLEKAILLGEPRAMRTMGSYLFDGIKVGEDKARSRQLLTDAAWLRDDMAQYFYSYFFQEEDSMEEFVWLRRSAMQGLERGVNLMSRVDYQVHLHDSGGSGRIVFEIGAAFANLTNWWEEFDEKGAKACERAIELHEKWCGQAKRGIWCWMWLSRTFAVPKDIRVLIAGLLWEQRAAWSERKPD